MRDRLIKIFDEHTCLRFLIPDINIKPLADILLENGVIVPPKKVYDTRLYKDGMKICEHEVKGVIYDCEYMAFDSGAIGKKIFQTRETAEQALKERNKDE